jgi:hypothetical protein
VTNPFIGTTTSQSGGGDFEIPDADIHYATLVAVIDLGTHEDVSQQTGKSFKMRQCALVWELDSKRKDGRSFFVAKQFALSLNINHKLMKALGDARGRAYGDNEPVHLDHWPGSKWSVSITHQAVKKNGKDRIYAKISALGAIKKGVTLPPPAIKPFCWWIGCGSPVPDGEWLPRIYGAKISDLIAQSDEMRPQQTVPRTAPPAAEGYDDLSRTSVQSQKRQAEQPPPDDWADELQGAVNGQGGSSDDEPPF